MPFTPMTAADNMAEIKFWFAAMIIVIAVAVVAAVGMQLAGVDARTSTIVIAVDTGLAGVIAANLRNVVETRRANEKAARDREQARLDREDLKQIAEQSAREREEVRRVLEEQDRKRAADARKVEDALVSSDLQHTTRAVQLQGAVDTMHSKVNKIEGFVDGEHGVVLRALAVATAQLAARPGATSEQHEAAAHAEKSSREHDEQQAIHEAKVAAAAGASQSVTIVGVSPEAVEAVAKLAGIGPVPPPSE